MELPIVSFLTALLWKLFGPQELLAGMIPVVCGIGTVVVLARFVTRLAGPAAGFAAGLFAAASPLFAWYGTTFQEEAPMLFASVLAVDAMERWLETDSVRDPVRPARSSPGIPGASRRRISSFSISTSIER